jgi:hypothetical protein
MGRVVAIGMSRVETMRQSEDLFQSCYFIISQIVYIQSSKAGLHVHNNDVVSEIGGLWVLGLFP